MKKAYSITIGTLLASSLLISLNADQAFSIAQEQIYRFVPVESKFNIMINLKDPYSKKILSNVQLKDEFEELFDTGSDNSSVIKILEESGESLLISANDMESKDGFIVLKTNSDKLALDMNSRIKNQVKLDKDAKVVETKYRDVKIVSIIPKNTNNYNFKPYYYAFVNRNIVMTSNVENIQDSIKAYYGKNILSYSGFKNVNKYISSNSQIKVLLDSKEDKSLFKTDNAMIGIKFNSKSVDFEYSAIPIISDKFSVGMVNKKTKNLSSILNSLPTDSLGFISTSNYNFYESLNSKDKKSQDKLNQFFLEALNITPNEFFGNLNSQFSLAVFNNKDINKFPGIAMFMEPKSKDDMLDTLSSISIDANLFSNNKGQRKNLSTSTKNKFSFSQLRKEKGLGIVSSTEIEELKKVDVRPEYMFIDNKLILTSSPSTTNLLVDRIVGKTTTLESNDNVKKLLTLFKSNNTDMGYVNLDLLSNMISKSLEGNKNQKSFIKLAKKFHALGFNTKTDGKNIYGKASLLIDWQDIDANLIQELTTGKKQSIQIKDL
ncbi:MAG: hypothetical protein ACK4IX_00870 [Candidatus Sericytochromatia bacterium]